MQLDLDSAPPPAGLFVCLSLTPSPLPGGSSSGYGAAIPAYPGVSLLAYLKIPCITTFSSLKYLLVRVHASVASWGHLSGSALVNIFQGF